MNVISAFCTKYTDSDDPGIRNARFIIRYFYYKT